MLKKIKALITFSRVWLARKILGKYIAKLPALMNYKGIISPIDNNFILEWVTKPSNIHIQGAQIGVYITTNSQRIYSVFGEYPNLDNIIEEHEKKRFHENRSITNCTFM